jgi:putative oxidoreductase
MAHASQGNPLLPILNQGDLAVLFCFVFLYFVFAGAGPWSVDAALRRRRA